jgi:hypothetical protein
LSRQSNILFNIPNNITYKLSEVRRGEEMGQEGKKGGREGWKISKERQKKEEYSIHAQNMQKGRGMGPQRKEGGETGRENYISC